MLHECNEPEGMRYASYGECVTVCYEDEDGVLWVSNSEYSSTANYCPFCGYKAKRQIGEKPPKPDPLPQPKAPQSPTLNTEFWVHSVEFPWSALSPLDAIREAAQILKKHDCGSPAVAWGTPYSGTEPGAITCHGGAGHPGPIHIGGTK